MIIKKSIKILYIIKIKFLLYFIFNLKYLVVSFMSENIAIITSENLKNEVLDNKGFSLIDFWAPWCGPCRMMLPIFEELSNEVKNVKFCKVNVDDCQDIASAYRVSGIPFFILFKDGKAVASKTGATSKEDFKDWIESSVKNNK